MEEPHSLKEIGKMVDRCLIVLELSENESFFDKKKNLLQSKGFDIREQISLDGLSSSDSVAATLEKMLQMARIIHLDEVRNVQVLCVYKLIVVQGIQSNYKSKPILLVGSIGSPSWSW
uniref:Uncharacterized protein MANES_14G152800 n=1 Tax=Rhizophora mucronata TaxID=61149 RepID=A0A2P2JPL1_RHIMU